MLTLERDSGRGYRSGALILLIDGQVIGEIIVHGGHANAYGGVSVHVGLHLPPEIEVVRADAVNRPSGPSSDWLREREWAYNTSGAYFPANAFPVVGIIDDLSDDTPGAPQLAAQPGAPDAPNGSAYQGDADDDDDAFYPDPGWGDSGVSAEQPVYAQRQPSPQQAHSFHQHHQRRPPMVQPPQVQRNLYVLREPRERGERGASGEEERGQ